MKVLANETKRILAVLLSVAMIFAYVPNNVAAYADDDVSGNDTTVAEESVTNEATNNVSEEPAEPAPSEPEEETVADEAANDANDVEITIANGTGAVFLDPYSAGGETPLNGGDVLAVDSSKNFSIQLAPTTGYSLNKTVTSLVTVGYTVDGTPDVGVKGTDYEIGDLADGQRTLTIGKAYLAEYKAARAGASDQSTCAFTITTLNGVDAYFPITYTGELNQPEQGSTWYEAQKGNAFGPITLKTLQKENTPITDVKVYTVDEDGKKTYLTITTDYSFTPATTAFTITAAGTGKGYTAGGIYVEALSETYSITQNEDSKEFATVTITNPSSKVAYDTDGVATDDVAYTITPVTDESADRTVVGMEYSIDGAAVTNIGADTSKVEKANVTGDIELYPVTAEALNWTFSDDWSFVDSSDIIGYSTAISGKSDGQACSAKVETNEDFSFALKATAVAKPISSVEYKIGSATRFTTLEPVNGVYTIGKDLVKNKITLSVNVGTATRTAKVAYGSIKVGDTEATTAELKNISITDKETGVAIKKSDDTPDALAESGEPYYFYINKAVATRFEVSSVKYSTGGVSDKAATLVDAKSGLYSIPQVGGDVTLNIVLKKVQDVVIPGNTKAVITVNNEVVKAGSTVTVEVGKPVAVTVSPAASTTSEITLTDVQYTGGTGNLLTDGETDNTVNFTIPASAVIESTYSTSIIYYN